MMPHGDDPTGTAAPSPQYMFPCPTKDAPSPASSSPSESRSTSPSATRAPLSFSLPTTVGLEHPTPRYATPSLPPYRPIPPLSPLSIISTLDDIASSAPKKKSHARKQPAGHIPRPRNAFILFRCLFVSQQAVPASVEKDHRNISRIAGKVWKAMSEVDREPWLKAAELEKTRHEQRWPGYRYNPVQTQAALRRLGAAAVPTLVGRTPAHPPVPDERRGRTISRPRGLKHEDAQYPPPIQHPQLLQLHAPLAQVASSTSWRSDDRDRNTDADGDAEMMPPPNLPSLDFASYTIPPAATTPTPANGFARLPGSGPSNTSSYVYNDLCSPEPSPLAPPPPITGMRLVNRRSSSCPPLPPPGTFAFPFNDPSPWASMATSFSNAAADLDTDMYSHPLSDADTAPPFRNPFSSTPGATLKSPFMPSATTTHANLGSRNVQTPLSFSNPFPSPPPFAFGSSIFTPEGEQHHHDEQQQQEQEQQRPIATAPYEQRPFTAPENPLAPPRYMHMHMHMHMDGLSSLASSAAGAAAMASSSRLLHRRGSSLDRAIASSSIAGAFGGVTGRLGGGMGLGIGLGMGMGLGMGVAHGHTQGHGNGNGQGMGQMWGGESQHQHQHADSQAESFSHNGLAKVASDPSLRSSDTGTPSLSPSPPSSFDESSDSQSQSQPVYHTPGDPVPAPRTGVEHHHAHHHHASLDSMCSTTSDISLSPSPFTGPPSPPSPPTPSRATIPITVSSPTTMPMSPPSLFAAPARKVSARLFGSQGVRLGLDLDLPLSLDVSFGSMSSGGKSDGHRDGRIVEHLHGNNRHGHGDDHDTEPCAASYSSASTSRSSPSHSPSFPYSPESSAGVATSSSSSFSYTQALLDMESDVGGEEFEGRSGKYAGMGQVQETAEARNRDQDLAQDPRQAQTEAQQTQTQTQTQPRERSVSPSRAS